jgi:hypothetical protein
MTCLGIVLSILLIPRISRICRGLSEVETHFHQHSFAAELMMNIAKVIPANDKRHE